MVNMRMPRVNRVTPSMPAHLMKSFSVLNPLETHFGAARCEDVDCHGYLHGWISPLDESDPKSANAAAWIRSGQSGRRFTERIDETGLTVFEFPAGQQCFKPHRKALDRDPLYVVQSGSPGRLLGDIRQHTNPDFFVEEMHETVDSLITSQQKG